jgi:predicted amidophosphoribosyltransferase
VFNELLGVILPFACPGCSLDDAPLCEPCRRRLLVPAHRVDPTVWEVATAGSAPLASSARYEGPVREIIVAWKEHGRLDLERPLAECLARGIRACLSTAGPRPVNPLQPIAGYEDRITLVPVPSSGAAVRRRGEDVVARLARRAALALTAGPIAPRPAPSPGWAMAPGARPGARPASRRIAGTTQVVAVRALRQALGVRDQAGLSAAERTRNTSGRIKIRRSIGLSQILTHGSGGSPAARLGPVVLVDDIVTTGASLAAAAAALRMAGALVLGAATIAWTPRRLPMTFGTDSPTLRTVGCSNPGLAWRSRPDERGEAPRG